MTPVADGDILDAAMVFRAALDAVDVWLAATIDQFPAGACGHASALTGLAYVIYHTEINIYFGRVAACGPNVAPKKIAYGRRCRASGGERRPRMVLTPLAPRRRRLDSGYPPF